MFFNSWGSRRITYPARRAPASAAANGIHIHTARRELTDDLQARQPAIRIDRLFERNVRRLIGHDEEWARSGHDQPVHLYSY
jgi:hypothetical protein